MARTIETDTTQLMSGVYVDSGRQTADDALREVIRLAADLAGFHVDPWERSIVNDDGWTDPETNDTEALVDLADDAEQWLNAFTRHPDCRECWGTPAEFVVDGGMFGEKPVCGFCRTNHFATRPIVHRLANIQPGWGWDGCIGGFGLWFYDTDGEPIEYDGTVVVDNPGSFRYVIATFLVRLETIEDETDGTVEAWPMVRNPLRWALSAADRPNMLDGWKLTESPDYVDGSEHDPEYDSGTFPGYQPDDDAGEIYGEPVATYKYVGVLPANQFDRFADQILMSESQPEPTMGMITGVPGAWRIGANSISSDGMEWNIGGWTPFIGADFYVSGPIPGTEYETFTESTRFYPDAIETH